MLCSLFQVILPFILVACGFHVVTSTTKTSQDGVFLLILLMSDFMGLVCPIQTQSLVL